MPYCEAHNQTPDIDFAGSPCYGELWECPGCNKTVCAGYGAADNQPDVCDDCAALNNPAPNRPDPTAVTL